MNPVEARWLKMTPDEIRAFQSKNRNHLGRMLTVDGDLGGQTRWALAMQTLPIRRRLIVWKATMCLGLDERLGANRHPIIDLFNRWAGADDGDSWCASMASACIGDVAIAGAQALARHYPPTLNPWPGDLAWFPTGPWQAHAWIVGGMTNAEVMGPEGNSANTCRLTVRARGAVQFARTCNDGEQLRHAVMPGIPTNPELPFVETKPTTEGTR